ncbi:MAG: tetratricopeptide repeat protein [Kiritimatiellia bacterium]
MAMLPFRPITRGRLRRARWTALAITLGALALYGFTLVSCAFPGDSATWIAWVTGLDTREAPSHPLLTALGHVISGLPLGSIAFRLNALAALAGALVVTWVYRLVWFFVFDTMREQSAITKASSHAQLAGIVAAATVGLSLPFWHAATHFRPEIFDVALLTGCAHLLIVYARTQQRAWLMLFGALYGMGMVESHLFLVAAPFMATFAVLIEWRLEWCRMKLLTTAASISLLMLVLTSYLTAWSFAVTYNHATGMGQIGNLLIQLLRGHFSAIHNMVPRYLWVPMLGMGVGAAVLSFLAAFRALNNSRTWSLLFLNTVLTVSALLLLVNVPFAPWSVQAAQGLLPVATYVLAGIGIGLLVASWRTLAVVANPVDETNVDDSLADPPASFAATRLIGWLAAPTLMVVIVVSGVLNGIRLVTDDGAFADRAADVVLDGLHGRTWVVGNGMIDHNLMIRAYNRGIVLHLLSPQRANDKNYTTAVLRTLRADSDFSANARLRAESLFAYNFLTFIEDLFATDPRIGEKTVTMGLPDIWYGSGWVPVPEFFFYGGARNYDAFQKRDLMAEQQAFWKQWDAFLKGGSAYKYPLSYRYRQMLRRHLAFVTNNRGVALDDLGRAEEAFQTYQKAHEIDPDNISALLNLFELVSRGLHPESKAAISSNVRSMVENPARRYSLWALSRYYGYVRNSDLFVKMGWSWALSSNPNSVLAGLRSVQSAPQDEQQRLGLAAMMAALHEMRGDVAQSASAYRKILDTDPKNTTAISGLVRLSLRQSIVDEARKVLEASERAGASKRMLRQNWAAVYLVSGDLTRARIILQELADEPNPSPMILAMLAMVMIEQNETASVERTILPKLDKVSGSGQELYFPLVVQGRLWQSKGKSGYRNAQRCFQRAAAIRPDVPALQDVILMLDASMENQTAAEAHALLLLRQRPDHPFANFIIGSIRLEQAQYADAELYLRHSVAVPTPIYAAINNLAQALCRNHKLDEAEHVARQATVSTPDRYEGWSTLAYVLAMAGKLDAAATALAKSHELAGTDARLFLVDALLAVKRGDAAGATKAVAAIKIDTSFSLSDNRDLNAIKAEITRLARNP